VVLDKLVEIDVEWREDQLTTAVVDMDDTSLTACFRQRQAPFFSPVIEFFLPLSQVF